MAKKVKIGLALTGGGAHACFQAGVLKAIDEICKPKSAPFEVISGVSAGALHGVWLAAHAENFTDATTSLWDLWAGLKMEDVFRTDTFNLMGIGAAWLRDVITGHRLGGDNVTQLLNTTPLRELITNKIDFVKIKKNISSGLIHGISVSATHYQSGGSVSFYNGDKSIKNWESGTRKGQRTNLSLGHVMASTAIPLFFPPELLDDGYFGDGGIGFRSPLSPTIHMGADRILAIGIRHMTSELKNSVHTQRQISIGDILGTVLNSIFLDSMDNDAASLLRINHLLSSDQTQNKKYPEHLRNIPMLAINPSKNLGDLAENQIHHFPEILRHLLKGLGVDNRKGWDLLSYLAFQKEYTDLLLRLGYSDAMNMKDQILEFMSEDV